jgi:hypothetical protein
MDGRTDWLKDDRDIEYLTPRSKMEFGSHSGHQNMESNSRMSMGGQYSTNYGSKATLATTASSKSSDILSSGEDGSHQSSASGGVVNNVINNLLGTGNHGGVGVEDSADPLLRDTSMNDIDQGNNAQNNSPRENQQGSPTDQDNLLNITAQTELGNLVADVKADTARSNRSANTNPQWSARSQPQPWSARSQQVI